MELYEFYIVCTPDGCEEFSTLDEAKERERFWIEEFEIDPDDVWIETALCDDAGNEVDDARLMAGDSQGGK